MLGEGGDALWMSTDRWEEMSILGVVDEVLESQFVNWDSFWVVFFLDSFGEAGGTETVGSPVTKPMFVEPMDARDSFLDCKIW
jgi:hypothetical protein